MNYAEKMGWIDDVQRFVNARKLRNLLVHEYMVDAELFLQSLDFANQATLMLTTIVDNIAHAAESIGLDDAQ